VWWNWFSVVALLAAAPWLLFPGGWRTAVLVLLPLLWIGNRIVTGHFIPRTPYDVVILSLLVMVLVSLYATYDIAVSLPKITGVLLGVSAFYVVVGFIGAPRQLNQVLTVLLLGVTVFLGMVLVGSSWGSKFAVLQQLSTRLPSLFRGLPGADTGFHPAEVGGTLTWLVFLPATVAIGLLAQGRIRRMWPWLIGLSVLTAALLLALLLTQSRSAWLGVAAGVAVLLWLLGRWGRMALGLGVVALVVMLALGVPERLLSNGGSSLVTVTDQAAFNPNLADRTEIWSRAIYGLQDFPFTGMGLGTFRYVLPVLYPLFSVSPDVDLGHAHNEWLQAGVDLGLVGLIAFLALQGLSLLLAYRAFRMAWPVMVRWLMAGVLAGLVAHSIFGLMDAVALGAKPSVLVWILMGLSAAVWRLGMAQSFHSSEASSSGPPAQNTANLKPDAVN
jgi:putative inorganic carbon (HCO3(-)) transporter